MSLVKLATACVLAGTASAKLVGWHLASSNQLSQLRHQSGHGEQFSIAESSRDQLPLSGTEFGDSEFIDKIPFKAGQFTLTPQDDTVCATNGEAHWTGTIDVTDSRRLFFAAFESRNDPENDPIIFWMNGGPGSSSTEGNFVELGPCWLGEDANKTVPNEWSWNNNATVVFLDQPAGVGLSTIDPKSYQPSTDMDGAEDFQVFLNLFFSKVFPEKAHLPITIAAESYGGHYGPTYLNHILESRRYNAAAAFRGNITGLILVDAVIDFAGPSLGLYQLLCEEERAKGIITEKECAEIRLGLPECEWLSKSCDVSKDAHACFAMVAYCQVAAMSAYSERILAGERSPYHIHRPCPQFPNDCAVPGQGNLTAYLNQPEIKKALKLSPSFEFESTNMALNTRYHLTDALWRPTTHLVSSVLDAYRTPKIGKENEHVADIKVLVLNGNEDAVVNTFGNMWQYDRVLWSGQAEYRAAKWREIPEEEVAATGTWKATRDGRLAFLAVDDAGHMVPGDVREGSYKIVLKWLHGGWHF